ncbi:hypothetical protein GOBAR_AA39290 [Gossypium barbadense]|uniref:Phosphorylated adapter RNA export protein n=1 Tax=Gossypium barbadense TaxID=3634 RepID=A0A2P5VRF7_GOSBA|nr:hypothetical protein GOBAR_AA39290 [Gossypium barbadense]
MEKGESILEVIYEEDDLGDVEMLDVEEGELVDSNSVNDPDKSGFADVNGENQGFVLDTCRRLKEKKSYMVYTAVGCLGISALSDLVKEIPFATSNPVPLAEMTDFISCLLIEVDAIQSCGGQMTADGRRCRTGGGILWNIIKAREPAAYREIMKKAKEFEVSTYLHIKFVLDTCRRLKEKKSYMVYTAVGCLGISALSDLVKEKQFKQQNVRQAPAQSKEISSQETTLSNGTAASVPQGAGLIPNDPAEEFSAEGARKSVHDRIRVPVSYEDLLGEDSKDD